MTDVKERLKEMVFRMKKDKRKSVKILVKSCMKKKESKKKNKLERKQLKEKLRKRVGDEEKWMKMYKKQTSKIKRHTFFRVVKRKIKIKKGYFKNCIKEEKERIGKKNENGMK